LSIARWILTGSVCLFATIGIIAFIKKNPSTPPPPLSKPAVKPALTPVPIVPHTPPTSSITLAKKAENSNLVAPNSEQNFSLTLQPEKTSAIEDFPQVDRIHQLFNTKGVKLPIVDTITYNSKVEWLKGRPAWIADYAVHYSTSRHFIARSLNGRPDYFTQKISTGGLFNVLRKDKDIQFYLLADISRFKLGLYYFDKGTNERVLIKTYSIGLGRLDPHSPSGCATPLGLYALGNKIAVYQPGTMGLLGGKEVEMVRVFGTRWIPFGQEIEGCTSPAKGLGLYGIPLIEQENNEGKTQFVDNCAFLNTNEGDGGIRLASEDINEIFSIVITRPSFVLLVKDFRDARLPGIEVDLPLH